MILAIKTDNPEAELYLLDSAGTVVDSSMWHAHRILSVDILSKIESLLLTNNADKSQLEAVVVFKGPGSFTGLRIGINVANALADGLNIPISGTVGDSWLENGFKELDSSPAKNLILPEYGGEANITKPRK